ncbi:NB-ARC domain-containing protein [Streptomyces sp. NEAU-NA10]|uniref:NB-ARC domain-containing protein n=1 Tax=Streptomyces sp. NEAU-NA10 TaxID=3416050 RepID=UPI003CC5FE12
MTAARSALQEFRDALFELWVAAGKPPYSALLRLEDPEFGVQTAGNQTLSDWFTGKSAPSEEKTKYALALIRRLVARIPDRSAQHQKFRQMQARLRAAQAERSQNRGGRPRSRTGGRAGARKRSGAAPTRRDHVDRHSEAVTTGGNSPVTVYQVVPPHEAAAHTVPYLELPPATHNFTGREAELAAVWDVLDPHHNEKRPATIAAISGMPGIGKSELAVQAAHAAQRRGWCPGGVLYVDLRWYERDDADAVADLALYDLLLVLGVRAERVPRLTGQRAQLYRDVLAQRARHCERFLVVLDNASSPEQVQTLLPSTGGIITSRETLARLDGVRLLRLDVLSPDDAVALISKALDASDSRMAEHPALARELARLCGHLPLALRIAAALLAEDPEGTVGELTAALADERERLAEIAQGDWAVRAAFDLSYERLAAHEARVFRLLSIRLGGDFSTETAAVLTGDSGTSVRRALVSLRRAGLVDRGTAEGRWRLHDLISVYVADLARAEESADDLTAARHRLLHHYAAVAEEASRQLWSSAGAGESRFEESVEALEWLDAEAVALVAAVHTAEDGRLPELVVRLSACIEDYLLLRRRFNDGLATAEAAVRAARALWDQQDERDQRDEGELAGALGRWGRWLAAVGRIEEAIEPLQSAAVAYRLIGNRRGEGMALRHFALARTHMYDNTAVAFERAIDIQRSLGDLTAEAASLLELSETVRKRAVLEPDSGQVLLKDRELQQAINWSARAVLLYRRAGGLYGEGKALRVLGRSWADMGHARALVGNLATVAQLRRVLSPDVENADLAYSWLRNLNRKAEELRSTGWSPQDLREARKAVRHLERSVEVFRRFKDPYGEVHALTDLAFAQGIAGDAGHETVLLDQAWRIAVETEDPHIQAVVLRGRGEEALRNERYEDAVRHFEEALRLFREIGDMYEEDPTRTRLVYALEHARCMDDANAQRNRMVHMSFRATMQASDGTDYTWDGLPPADEESVQDLLRRVTAPFASDSPRPKS